MCEPLHTSCMVISLSNVNHVAAIPHGCILASISPPCPARPGQLRRRSFGDSPEMATELADLAVAGALARPGRPQRQEKARNRRVRSAEALMPGAGIGRS